MAVTQGRQLEWHPVGNEGAVRTAASGSMQPAHQWLHPGLSREHRGAVGSAYDNGTVESFLATLGCELIDRSCFRTQAEARMAIFRYIECWYAPPPPSALGQRSPLAFERLTSNAALIPSRPRPRGGVDRSPRGTLAEGSATIPQAVVIAPAL